MSLSERNQIPLVAGATGEAGYSSETLVKLQKLQEQLMAHNGEFVLVVTRSWQSADSIRKLYHPHEEIVVGVIKEPYITNTNITGSDITIETDRFAKLNGKGFYYDEEVETRKGSINFYGLNVAGLDVPVGENPGEEGWYWRDRTNSFKYKIKVEVIVGDEAVLEWIVMEQGFGHYKESAKRAMGIPDLRNFYLKDNYFSWGILSRFDQVQKGLGRTVHFPYGLQDDYEIREGIRQANIIKYLRNPDSLTETGVYEALREAVTLGMHNSRIVVIEPVSTGVSIHIEVGKYIEDLASRFGVELPK